MEKKEEKTSNNKKNPIGFIAVTDINIFLKKAYLSYS